MASATPLAPEVGISFADLLRYQEIEAARWRAWLEQQPREILDLPFGDAAKRMGNVRDMLWHIVIVEWVYARVINGEPLDGWDRMPSETIEDLFAIRGEAHARLSAYLGRATEADMTRRLTLSGGGATIHGSSRKFLTHTFLHSLRHWAQLATVLRQHGHQTDWHHDFVLSDAIE
jgi:uncharacterized damage-inducible protein DinB